MAQDTEREKPPRFTLVRLIEFLVAPAAVLTALAYLAGWLYKLNYFAAFGIRHESLVLAREYYLTASWTSFFLGVVLLLAGATCSIWAITLQGTRGDETKSAFLCRFVWKIILSVLPIILAWVFMFILDPWYPPPDKLHPLIRIPWSKDLVLGVVLLVLTLFGIGILWLPSYRRNQKAVRPEDALAKIGSTDQVPRLLMFLMLVMIYLVTFLLLAGWLGKYHAGGAIKDVKLPLPEATLYAGTDHPLPIAGGILMELPNPGLSADIETVPVYLYEDLRLIIFNDEKYYVFRPSEVEKEEEKDRPKVYVITEESLLHMELKPIPRFALIY